MAMALARTTIRDDHQGSPGREDRGIGVVLTHVRRAARSSSARGVGEITIGLNVRAVAMALARTTIRDDHQGRARRADRGVGVVLKPAEKSPSAVTSGPWRWRWRRRRSEATISAARGERIAASVSSLRMSAGQRDHHRPVTSARSPSASTSRLWRWRWRRRRSEATISAARGERIAASVSSLRMSQGSGNTIARDVGAVTSVRWRWRWRWRGRRSPAAGPPRRLQDALGDPAEHLLVVDLLDGVRPRSSRAGCR